MHDFNAVNIRRRQAVTKAERVETAVLSIIMCLLFVLTLSLAEAV